MEGDLQRRLGENLRAVRKARGLSQEAFADFLSVHRTYMGSVERGERNLTLRTVERLGVCCRSRVPERCPLRRFASFSLRVRVARGPRRQVTKGKVSLTSGVVC